MFLTVNICYRLIERPLFKCIKMMSYPICKVFPWFWCECLQMNGLYILFYEASSDVCGLTMCMVWYQEEQCLKNINRLATLFLCLINQMLLGLFHWKALHWFFFKFHYAYFEYHFLSPCSHGSALLSTLFVADFSIWNFSKSVGSKCYFFLISNLVLLMYIHLSNS